MKKTLKNLLAASLVAAAFSGCAGSNPFGVGHEKSSCEISSGFGVCGSPKDIYIHKDVIKKVQKDYMKSGYPEELFFAVSPTGDMLVKEKRESAYWQNYNTSDIRKDIMERLSKKGSTSNKKVLASKVNMNISMKQDIPVTHENDLSVKFQKRKFLLETTEVGGMIRDNGKVQKVWLAPVVDKKDNLISARTMYVVLKDPKWVIGEKTPKTTSKDIIPTPMSEEILKKQQRYDDHQEKVVKHFNNNNTHGLKEEIKNNPKKQNQEISKDMLEIQKFLER